MDDQQVMHALRLDDAYQVERVLASGPCGTTELVTLGDSGPFVRKHIPLKLARRGVWGTLSDCGCARLPHVVASYEMPDEYVVVCEYVPGENLEHSIAGRGKLDEEVARKLVLELCEAVSALHMRGIVHRDIAPTNIVVAADGAHLIDLGIARYRTEGATHDTTQLGTPGFASPEQYGFAQTDARSDVYSLGRVLGYVLTGIQPDVSASDEYEAALADERVVSPEVRQIVQRASAMEPSARYQSVDELSAALRNIDLAAVSSCPQNASTDSAVSRASDATASFKADKNAALANSLRHRMRLTRRRLCLDKLSQLGRKRRIGMVIATLLLLAFLGRAAIGIVRGWEMLYRTSFLGQSTTGQVTAGQKSSTQSVDGKTVAEQGVKLSLAESGYSISQGYVLYAFGLHNDGDLEVEVPGVTITGRDAQGKVLFTQEQYINAVPAGQTVYFGGQAGNGTAPATVEFEPIHISKPIVGSSARDVPVYTVQEVRAVSDGLGGIKFVGEVTCEKNGTPMFDSDQVAVSVVLRDGSGAIVFGSTGFVTKSAENSSVAFEVDGFGAPTNYASVEAYAQAW